MSFTDDNSFPEERTSDAFPSTGTVAALPVLVSNLGQGTASGFTTVGNRSGTNVTQGFTTGTHPGGYRLTGVTVALRDSNFTGAETATFKIYSSEANGTPRSELYELITPSLPAASDVFFPAPPGAKLDPSETYFVVFQGSGDAADLSLRLTDSNSETGETGWTLEDAYRINESPAMRGRSIRLSIHGVANSAATGNPTISGASFVGLTLARIPPRSWTPTD